MSGGWLRWTVFVTFSAVVVHLAAVALTPTLIMSRVLGVVSAQKESGIHFAERPTAAARNVVRQSPDLLYSTCVFDVSRGPVKVTTGAPTDTYWSVAFYADNTDNFFVLNDRQAGGAPATIVLLGPGQAVPAQAQGVTVVSAPSATGLILFRTLITDDAREAEIDGQRRLAKCERL